jgi:hypothetical protein
MGICLRSKSLKNGDKALYPMLADLFLLFSRATSWRILFSLCNKARTLAQISKDSGISHKKILPELMTLLKKDILVSYTRSQKTYYRLADDRIFRAFGLIYKISRKNFEQTELREHVPKTIRIAQRPH